MTSVVKTFQWIEVHSKATRLQDTGKSKIGDEITVTGGVYCGMGGGSWPAWSEYGAEHFTSLEQAKEAVKSYGSSSYGFVIIPDTIEYVHVARRVQTDEVRTVIDVTAE